MDIKMNATVIDPDQYKNYKLESFLYSSSEKLNVNIFKLLFCLDMYVGK